MGNLLTTPTADQIARGHDLTDKVAIVTGASAGIGQETTRALAKRGALVYLTCRDLNEGHRAKRSILEQIGTRFSENICVAHLDLASFRSISAFVQEFQKRGIPWDYLILNGAVLGVPYQLTKEGFEMHFGVNYMGHFYLTQSLLPLIQDAEDIQPRVVAVCCSPPRRARLSLKTAAKGKKQHYSFFKAYDQSKLALRFFAEELSLRTQGSNLTVVGADPGVTNTWIVKHLNPIILSVMAFVSIFMNTPQQGAATVVFACLDRRIPMKPKPFCSRCRLQKFNILASRNPKLRAELYEKSLEWMNANEVASTEAFNPKNEVWKSVSRMVMTMVRQRTRPLSKKRLVQGAAKYQKLE